MEFDQLLHLLGDLPAFNSSLLLTGNVKPENVRLQLSRWTRSGRVYQLRRGLYAIAPPYQKVIPHPFLVANLMQRASYVSLQSALSFYGLIPETMQATLSVTAGRPERRITPLGVFEFRHIRRDLLRGYRMTELQSSKPGQQALMATPEKALLDLVYLTPGGGTIAYLRELRLQNMERLDVDELHHQAEFFDTPKLLRAAETIAGLAKKEPEEFEAL
jgi:predicted transcriptional regulator of viral defense system